MNIDQKLALSLAALPALLDVKGSVKPYRTTDISFWIVPPIFGLGLVLQNSNSMSMFHGVCIAALIVWLSWGVYNFARKLIFFKKHECFRNDDPWGETPKAYKFKMLNLALRSTNDPGLKNQLKALELRDDIPLGWWKQLENHIGSTQRLAPVKHSENSVEVEIFSPEDGEQEKPQKKYMGNS